MVHKDFKEEDFILYEKHRIFIDICYYGCGSGCRYCYVIGKEAQQELLSLEEINLICKYIENNYCQKFNIISLCPHTEPMKSKESINNILYIVNYFYKFNCIFQISTKEMIPLEFLNNINLLSNKIYINISMPFLNKNYQIEPNAGSVYNRMTNFEYISKFRDITFCLYIKPFVSCDQETKFSYIRLINKYCIKNVCVGPIFENSTINPCLSMYNEKKLTR